MTSTDSTILAVEAAGQFAGLVVPELTKRGAKVRGLIRDAKQGDAVLKNGAAEVAISDLSDRASLDKALKGVSSVFYIAPAFIPAEVAISKDCVFQETLFKLMLNPYQQIRRDVVRVKQFL